VRSPSPRDFGVGRKKGVLGQRHLILYKPRWGTCKKAKEWAGKGHKVEKPPGMFDFSERRPEDGREQHGKQASKFSS